MRNIMKVPFSEMTKAELKRSLKDFETEESKYYLKVLKKRARPSKKDLFKLESARFGRDLCLFYLAGGVIL